MGSEEETLGSTEAPASTTGRDPHPIDAPLHYNAHPSGIEAIEVTRLCPFGLGNAIKYIWRHIDKDGNQDLAKARWYLQDVITHGHSHHLPFKAKALLGRALVAETNHRRHGLLALIHDGQLHKLIEAITDIVGDADE